MPEEALMLFTAFDARRSYCRLKYGVCPKKLSSFSYIFLTIFICNCQPHQDVTLKEFQN